MGKIVKVPVMRSLVGQFFPMPWRRLTNVLALPKFQIFPWDLGGFSLETLFFLLRDEARSAMWCSYNLCNVVYSKCFVADQ